ncbi:MAG: ABC transporter ATP-binding protein [Culicoidibacterales bacterium]
MGLFQQLWLYTKKHIKRVIIGVLALTFSMLALILTPLVVREILDNQVGGLTQSWYQVSEPVKPMAKYVEYQGSYYVPQRFYDQAMEGKEVAIIAVDQGYQFVMQPVATYTVDNGAIILANGEKVSGKVLKEAEIWQFYQPFLEPLIATVGLFLLVAMIGAITSFFASFSFRQLSNAVVFDIRQAAFKKMQRLPIDYFSNVADGKIVAYITNDTEAVRSIYENVIAAVLQGAVVFIGAFVGIFYVSPLFGMIALILIPILAGWIWVYRRFASKYNLRARAINSDINASLNEQLKGIEVIRAFNYEAQATTEFDQLCDQYFSERRKLSTLGAGISGSMVHVVRRTLLTLALIYFGTQALNFELGVTIGTIYAVVDYINRLAEPLWSLFNILAIYEDSRSGAVRVFEFLAETEESNAEQKITQLKGDIVFQDVDFAYVEGQKVLKAVSFHAKPGQTVALVGHTGSGKSSLMNVLLRFYDYQAGSITIDGQELQTLNKQSYRQHIGMVLQDPVLFAGTVYDNIVMERTDITQAEVLAAFKRVGAEFLLDKLPLGLDEPVLEMGSHFSLGERQLLAFVRAIIFNPAILILDEATANIDTETEQLIQRALDIVKQNRTTFIIAHRLSTIKTADQIIVLDAGCVYETGTHESLLKVDGKYAQMYAAQVK